MNHFVDAQLLTKTSFFDVLKHVRLVPPEFQPDSSVFPQVVKCLNCHTNQERYLAVIRIFLISLVFVFATMVIIAGSGGGEYFQEHLRKNRCNPMYMPFMGYFLQGESSTSNFNKCLFEKGKGFFNVLSVPLQELTKEMVDGTNAMKQNLFHLNKSSNYMVNDMMNKIDNSYAKMDQAQSIATYLMLKLKAILEKIGVFVQNLYYMLITLFDFTNIILLLPSIIVQAVMSVFWISLIYVALLLIAFVLFLFLGSFGAAATIGSMLVFGIVFSAVWGAVGVPLDRLYQQANNASYCCFPSHTMISLENETQRCIHEIRLQDYLRHHTKVTGILQALSTQRDWYQYNNTTVAGDHFVFEKEHWIRVKHSEYGMKLNGRKYPTRYCLVTDKHSIYTPDGSIFRDFQEICSPSLLMLQSYHLLEKLNHAPSSVPLNEYYEKGETGKGLNNVFIKKGNQQINIKDIQLGDFLEKDNQVVGIYTCLLENTFGMSHHGDWFPLHTIVFDPSDQVWKKIYMMYPSHPLLENPSEVGYYLLTSKGYFTVISESGQETIVRDLREEDQVII